MQPMSRTVNVMTCSVSDRLCSWVSYPMMVHARGPRQECARLSSDIT